jgi:antitoxin component YwqK of YwqJK toxin-antitoxin module
MRLYALQKDGREVYHSGRSTPRDPRPAMTALSRLAIGSAAAPAPRAAARTPHRVPGARRLPYVAAAAALALFAVTANAQPQRCEVGGKDVNPANGSTTAGLTGIMVCRDGEGRIQREQELKNGVFMGLQRMRLPDGGVRERQVNDRGNSDGPFTEHDAKGTLRIQGSFANGRAIGVHRRWFDNGQLERLSFHADDRERANLLYNRDGTLRELRCANESVMSEDRAPCGFEGKPAVVELRDGRARVYARATYERGQLIARSAFREDGSVAGEHLIENGARVHREYAAADGRSVMRRERVFEPDDAFLTAGGRLALEREWGPGGQPVREARFEAGLPVTEQQWYLNGSVRLRRAIEHAGEGRLRSALTREEAYRDDGTLAARTVQRDGRPSGPQRFYDPRGQLRREDVFTELKPGTPGPSRLLARRTWDEGGRPLTNEEFFEDGSRKLP